MGKYKLQKFGDCEKMENVRYKWVIFKSRGFDCTSTFHKVMC
jgi:hypothetical protein